MVSILWLLSLLFPATTIAQGGFKDSLMRQISTSGADSTKAQLLLDLSDEFLFIDNDSSAKYAREAIEISEKHHLPSKEYGGLCMLCIALSLSGNYSPALESGMKALAIAESPG